MALTRRPDRHGGAQHPITWERAGGPDPDFAEQLWFYVHDATGPRWTQGGISTVLPSDLLRVGDTLYLHVMGLSFRRLAKGSWILGGFLSSKYALGYRTIDGPTANMYTAPIQMPVTGSGWDNEDHSASRVAQLYGGYVLPGSRLDVAGGVGLVVSQWKTDSGWPYRAMQFRSTLKDTTLGTGSDPADPINL